MSFIDIISSLLLLCGSGFFLLGAIALFRFPDVYSRLHALTIIDNTGLGLIITGLALQAESLTLAARLLLIWLLVLLASASVAYLIANATQQRGIKPWTS